jgi:hypothetical protein
LNKSVGSICRADVICECIAAGDGIDNRDVQLHCAAGEDWGVIATYLDEPQSSAVARAQRPPLKPKAAEGLF